MFFEITIKATITKTETIEADSEEQAESKAHECFDTNHTGPEQYTQDTVSCVLLDEAHPIEMDGHEIQIYDNDGETIDRYTIVIDGDTDNCYGMSDNPFHPMGFSQYVGRVTSEVLDRQKKLKEIPTSIIEAIRQRIED